MKAFQSKLGLSYIVREAKVSDSEAILPITEHVLKEGFGVSTPEEFHGDVEVEREWIKGYIEGEHHNRLFVAEHEGELMGLINFDCPNKAKLRHQGSFGMSVATKWRGQGVGEALLVTLLEFASEHASIDTVRLDVLATNERAIRLYEKLGFVHEGRRVRFVKTEAGYEDLLLMAKHV
ncbi:GNAT family N-acetyltransferase [Paenalkalicoccus suaedae]|uniref:GNAT family N-acetyltransferase n=1 Tax=Paenalkalicoccus suaedae TaxID=2592382 RepID=A0A859FAG6_9BACI|nr:GNAT family N-acetyltransferase [Paenalkalicoccus suaedae]QKS69927.1 GNAT family N-acetyltransferase [Paenalkalicoccus suaedae]